MTKQRKVCLHPVVWEEETILLGTGLHPYKVVDNRGNIVYHASNFLLAQDHCYIKTHYNTFLGYTFNVEMQGTIIA